MNYSDLIDKIEPKLREAVLLINNPEVSPDIRQRMLEILFQQIGDRIYTVIYDMSAWDLEIPGSVGTGQGDYYYKLAKDVSDSVTLSGNKESVESAVHNWMNNVVGKAQGDTFDIAKDFGKHPTLERVTCGAKTCEWCQSHAGVFIEPTREMFGRHMNCDCKLITSGYHSRNGELKNYMKQETYLKRIELRKQEREANRLIREYDEENN